MGTLLLLIVVLFVCPMAAMAYLLGFRLGSTHNAEVLLRVREERLLAEREALQLACDAMRTAIATVEQRRHE